MNDWPEIDAVLSGESDGCIICADCLDVLPTLKYGSVDAVVTDPPYGVDLGKRPSALGKKAYESTEDTKDFVRTVAVPTIETCRKLGARCVVWPGVRNAFEYPQPDEIGCVYCAAGIGVGRWGFTCCHPILYYGKDPYLAVGLGSRPNSFASSESSEKNGHPCPKPIGWMLWAVERCSFKGELIVDPFAGSGTTLVAARRLGRRYIGIEIEPKYVEIAKRRLEKTPRPMADDSVKNKGKVSFF